MGMQINPLLFEGEYLVRQIDKDDEVWFIGADVCRVLGLSNPHSSLALLDEDERDLHSMEGEAGLRDMIIVSEAGVYRLVFKSRKPVAERFKRWLAHEVIPSLRKTGSYGAAIDGEVIPDLPEKRPFPDWPLEEWRIKGQTVDRYIKLYGLGGGQWVGQMLGFPAPPPELVDRGRQLVMVLVPEEDI